MTYTIKATCVAGIGNLLHTDAEDRATRYGYCLDGRTPMGYEDALRYLCTDGYMSRREAVGYLNHLSVSRREGK